MNEDGEWFIEVGLIVPKLLLPMFCEHGRDLEAVVTPIHDFLE